MPESDCAVAPKRGELPPTNSMTHALQSGSQAIEQHSKRDAGTAPPNDLSAAQKGLLEQILQARDRDFRSSAFSIYLRVISDMG